MEKVNILLVDDQPGKLLSYQAILAELDENLVLAKSGREALQCLLKQDIALILLDVVMPEMDGFETATLIRQHPRLEQTPIIFVTALSTSDLDRLKGYALGAVDYVFVPVVPEILRAKVSVFVELYRKRQELQNEIAAREKTENKFRGLLEAAPDAIVILNRDGNIVLVNSQTETLFGYPREELFGKSVEILMPVCFRERHSAHRAGYFADPRLRPMGADLELRGLRKNGTEFPVEISLSPLATEDGMLIISAIRDITERKRAEEALSQQTSILQSILDSMADAVIVVDAEGRLLLFNPAAEQIHGIATTDTISDGSTERYGVFLPDMVTPYQSDKLPLTRVLRGEAVDTAEMFVRHAKAVNGAWVSANARQLKDENGVVRGGVTVIRDITESKLAEEELRSSREELRNLSAHLQSVREDERTRIAREIHDELGQNLTALRLDLLWLSRHLAENQAPLQEKIQAMSQLINATARSVQRISMELRPGLLDDLGLVAAIEWQIEQFRERTGIACEVNPFAENIVMDRDRATVMFRIFQEILTNIARHAQATRVKIRLVKNKHELVLKVKDNGRGITPREIEDPHSIGLIGMRERVYPWKGKVKIKGISGQGTSVTVSIPLDKPSGDISLLKNQVKSS
jgi:PAS domain S-box-containing protein